MRPYCKDYQPTKPAVRQEYLRRSIISATNQIQEAPYDHIRRHWTNHIGRCLLLMGEVDEAALVFEGTMILSAEDSKPTHYATCDTCNAEDFIVGDRYICYTCAEADACASCMQKHQQKPFLPTCKGHQFLKIPRDGWQVPTTGATGAGVEATAGQMDEMWLDRMIEKYEYGI